MRRGRTWRSHFPKTAMIHSAEKPYWISLNLSCLEWSINTSYRGEENRHRAMLRDNSTLPRKRKTLSPLFLFPLLTISTLYSTCGSTIFFSPLWRLQRRLYRPRRARLTTSVLTRERVIVSFSPQAWTLPAYLALNLFFLRVLACSVNLSDSCLSVERTRSLQSTASQQRGRLHLVPKKSSCCCMECHMIL